MTCPDCKGSGKLTLFTSIKPCAKCGGTGEVADKPFTVNDCDFGIPEPGDPYPISFNISFDIGKALEEVQATITKSFRISSGLL